MANDNLPIVEIIIVTGDYTEISEDLPVVRIFTDGDNYFFGEGFQYIEAEISRCLNSLSAAGAGATYNLTVAIDIQTGNLDDALRSFQEANSRNENS